jgi:protein TonB
MSYLDRTHDPRQRTIGAAGTLIAQGLIGYLVLTGLANKFAPPKVHPPLTGANFPLPTPTPAPTPTPTAKQTPRPESQPHNPLPPQPPISPKTDDNPVDHGSSTGIGTVDLPPLPPPPPSHPVSFLAKGASPIGNPASWALTDDYPGFDLTEGHEGTTVFRVAVGTDGHVTRCDVVRSSGYRGLDAATCSAVKRRARFNPATDDNGQKVAGSYTNSVRWQIPR